MGIIVGIDVGGSTTKIVGFRENGKMIRPLFVKANDQITSLFGAFGKFTSQNGISLADIEQVMVTGVGSTYVNAPVYGLPTGGVDEFLSTGLGGLYLSGHEKAVVVSMGTGTAYVYADQDSVRHIGGSGVGGGTLIGLSNRMLGINKVDNILALAKDGKLENVDLLISDITEYELPLLPSHVTASNFGKLSEMASNSDVALGLINLVFQTIGMLAVFAARLEGNCDIILTGNLSNVPEAEKYLEVFAKRYHATFCIPKNSEYATAVGAALAYMEGKAYTAIPMKKE